MTTFNIEWRLAIPEPPLYDKAGRKLVHVYETAEGYDERMFVVPGIVSRQFIDARREAVARLMQKHGHYKVEPIDWTFLKELKQ